MIAWWSTLTRRSSTARAAFHEADAFLLVHVVFFAALVPLLMRFKLAWLEKLLAPRGSGSPSAETVKKIVRHLQLARKVGPPLVRTGCLTRGVTLCYFLRRAGADVVLCFGIRELSGAFAGHCWLIQGDTPILEDEDPRPLYTEMFTIPCVPDGGRADPRRLRAFVSM